MLFSDDIEYPAYNQKELGNVTETDGDPPLMPYAPDKYQ
jgi:hypothetical protein